jgi:hypothetical protein
MVDTLIPCLIDGTMCWVVGRRFAGNYGSICLGDLGVYLLIETDEGFRRSLAENTQHNKQ